MPETVTDVVMGIVVDGDTDAEFEEVMVGLTDAVATDVREAVLGIEAVKLLDMDALWVALPETDTDPVADAVGGTHGVADCDGALGDCVTL